MDPEAYLKFLQSKVASAAREVPADINLSLIHPSTKPHQRDAIVWALQRQTALLALSFGLGKTHIESEIARQLVAAQPGSKFLLVCPLGVRHQFIDVDGPRLGIDWQYVFDDATLEAADTPFVVSNYERLRDGNITPSKHALCGVSLDEGSVMRSLGSKTVDVFQRVLRDIPNRFIATATPSPNSYRELIVYADSLGVMDIGQARTRWFKRNPAQAGDLQLHPQHEADFWLWVSTWALFLNRPSDMGYSDEGYVLPALNVHWHRIPVDHSRAFAYQDNRGQHKMLVDSVGNVTQNAKEKRATLPGRLAAAQQILADNPGRNWLLWHTLEDERRAIEQGIPGAVSVYGSLDLEERERRILAFAAGELPILATKPELSGSGCNFQYACYSNIFLGLDYKFEDFIQAVHRTQRYQQQHPVDVHLIYAESEEPIADALKAKWAQHDTLVENMRAVMREYGLDHRRIDEALKRQIGVTRTEVSGQHFKLVHNDCVLETARMADNSVGMIMTSIPFGTHYEYTVNVEDFGHNEDDGKFFEQMDFLIPELLRVLQPGRIAAVHVKDRVLHGYQTKSGWMEVDPFSDLTVAAFRRHGFLYEGRRTIVTDVVRENASSYRLGWTAMTRDASTMGCGMPEYVLLFRKPPSSKENTRADVPVVHSKDDFTLGRWQLDAHGFWRSDGNTLVPSDPAQLVHYLLDLISAKEPYDYEEHVARLDDKGRRGHLTTSYMCDAPDSRNGWVWDDITFMRGLNTFQYQRRQLVHICPLPFDLVERTINLYSNPGDVIYDSFAGLGTVAYCALKLRREGLGVELAPTYFADGVRYCREMEAQITAPTLFDLMAGEKETAPAAAD